MVSPSLSPWQQRFEPVPASARRARRFVERTLDDVGFRGDVDTVLLLVSEVVSNAVRHARTPFELQVDADAAEVVVTVVDDSPDAVRPLPQDPDAPGGRGLFIVEQLAATWGTTTTDTGGKAVWFACS